MHLTDFIEENAHLKRYNLSLEQANSRLESELDLVRKQMSGMTQQFDEIKQQLEWFKRQVFDRKSEKQIVEQSEQGHLFQRQPPAEPTESACTKVQAHQRRSKQRSEVQ